MTSPVIVSKDGYLHFVLATHSYKMHPDSSEVFMLLPPKEREQTAHWVPALVTWKKLPRYLQTALKAAVDVLDRRAIAANAVNAIRAEGKVGF